MTRKAFLLARLQGPLVVALAVLPGMSRADLWASSAGGSLGLVSLSAVNPTTGAASELFSIMGGSGSGVSDLAGDPFWQGAVLWGVRSAFSMNYLAAWNPATSSYISEIQLDLSPILRTLAIDPTDGRFYATTDTALYRIEPTTGSVTLVGTTGTVSVAYGLAFDGNGQLFGVSAGNKLAALDKTSGATTVVGAMSLSRIEDIAWRATTGTMLGVGYPGSGGVNYSLYEIDLTTAAVVRLGDSQTRPSGLAFTGLAADFDSDGTVTTADLEVWRTHLGTTSGSNTAHGDANGDGAVDGADYLAWQRQLGSTVISAGGLAPVPEPNAAALGFCGLAAGLASRFRRGAGAP